MSLDNFWYDMDGKPISTEEFVARTKADRQWRCVARTYVGERYVSTVLLGSDHSFGEAPPIIFESMVFPECKICERYSTLEEAKEGHARMVAQLETRK